MTTSPPTLGDRRVPEVSRSADHDWRHRVALGVLAAAGLGLVTGWWTPRGPISTIEALAAIALSLAVGAFAGAVMRTRWAMLAAPATFAVAFELTRVRTAGPMVDGIHLSSELTIAAFILGRGVHGLLTLLPMVLGAVLGAAAARRRSDVPGRQSRTTVGQWLRRGVTTTVTLGVLALTVAIARPASTDPITGADGTPLPDSVAELIRVPVGGHDLSMMIRGSSVDNPVLLFLAGGPGGSELGAMRRHGQALERDFVVATFDQRGTGKSYDELEPTSTMTLAAAVTDAVEVTNYLRQRFHRNKIYLVGQSWGTVLGVLAVQQHPELYAAYIGTGQMVDITETDRITYADTLAWARRTNNDTLARTLSKAGPPPYTNMIDYAPALANETQVYPYDHTQNAEGAGGFSTNIFVKEYSLMEQLHTIPAFLDVATLMYPQLKDIDLRTQATRLKVPVYLVQGRHEAPGRARPAEQWFRLLAAPSKHLSVLDTSGHRAMFEQPAQFDRVMTQLVLPQTQPGR